MISAVEIEATIRTLSPIERKKLVRDLPALLPELDGDEAWKRIMDDPAPSSALSAYVDAIDNRDAKANSVSPGDSSD